MTVVRLTGSAAAAPTTDRPTPERPDGKIILPCAAIAQQPHEISRIICRNNISIFENDPIKRLNLLLIFILCSFV